MACKKGLCQRHVGSSIRRSGKGGADRPGDRSTDAEVVRELGINAGTLGNRVRKDRAARGDRSQSSEDERAELARLRKENTDLRMQRDVLVSGGTYGSPRITAELQAQG